MDKTSSTTMYHQKYLTNCKSYYSCIYCRTHLANHDELISRSFQGNRSRAYLFNSVINIITGPAVQRELNTGSHAVADIFCSNCNTTIGWKYERAYVESQKYKEGKFIIELAHVVRENRHLELDKRDMFLGVVAQSICGTGSSRASASQLQRQQRGAKTIGQQHRGSLSPTSTTSGGTGGTGRWSSSSGASSSSSSEGSSSSSSSGSEGIMMSSVMANYNDINHGTRYGCGDNNFDDHGGQAGGQRVEDSDDEEEVLMFPFHDDLFGERASYSNLAATRSLGGHRRRLRRSLHLDSTPYDWKYSSISSSKSSGVARAAATAAAESPLASPSSSSSSSSSPPSAGRQQSEPLSQFTSTSTSCPASPSFLSSPSTPYQQQQQQQHQTGTYKQNTRSSSVMRDDDDDEHMDYSEYGEYHHEQRHEDSDIQFKLEQSDDPEQEYGQRAEQAILPTSEPKVANYNNINRNCDQSLDGHEDSDDHAHRKVISPSQPPASTSTSSLSSILPASCSKTLDQRGESYQFGGSGGSFAIQPLNINKESRDSDDDDDDYSPPRITSNNLGDNTSQNNLLSLDEDEFYDCCTDHNVSNSILAGK